MRLPKDLLSGSYRKPSVFLCETDKQKICELETIDMRASLKFNAYSELTFTVPRTYTNMTTGETQVNPHYNKIEALRLIYLESFGYFEIQDPEIVSDGIREAKNITAYSLEYTLAQKYLEGLKINTGEIDSLEVIEAQKNGEGSPVVPIMLWGMSNPNLNLLSIVLEKAYGWSVGHIDPSLYETGRTFEISRVSIYDFIVQEICEKFNCFAVFDTIENKINLYAEAPTTRFIGNDWQTTFRVSPAYESLGTVSIDSYKTTSYTYEVRLENNINTGFLTFTEPPENGAIIEVTDGSQKQWETDVYVSFNNLAQEVNVSYSADDIKTVLTVKGADDMNIREVNMGLPYIVDLTYYHTVEWMGQDLYDAYTNYVSNCSSGQVEYQQNAQEMIEIDSSIKYEDTRLSLEYSIADTVNETTVGTYYIQNGAHPNYYYTEVKLPDDWISGMTYYMLSGTDIDTEKVSDLYDALEQYFKSENQKDVSGVESIKDNFSFVKTYTIDSLITDLTNAETTEQKDNAVKSFMHEMFDQLGKTPLNNNYYLPYKQRKEAVEEGGVNTNEAWDYHVLSLFVTIIEDEIDDRKEIIEEYEKQYDTLAKRNFEIYNNSSIYNCFTKEQLLRLGPFLREDEYTDDTFVETDADSIDDIMRKKHELLECGRIELKKLCEPKLEFSMDMANIYALPEFEPIINQFKLGNLINVAIRDDYIKRARLLEVDINFDDFSDFTCEFGELTSLRTQSSIHADLLANAISAGKSVASHASYWNQSSDSVTSLALQIQQGLLDATTVIKAVDGNQGMEIDKYGMHLRKYDESTGALDPKEGWIVNNQFLYSDDNFKTTKSVFGEYTIGGQTKWGLLAEAVMAGYLAGCTIEGGTINIGNGTFVVDQFGNVTMNSGSIKGYVTNDSLQSQITTALTDKGIETKVSKDSIISTINQSAESVAIDANKISLAGKTIDLTSDNITIDSTYFSVAKDGKITATSGEIAGWTIYDSLLRKETVVDDVTYQMYMQASDGVSTTNAFAVRKKNPDVSSWDTQFSVSYAGKMTAKNANITGTITAKDGSIAGYNIGPGGCYDNAIYKRVAGDGSGVDYEVGLKATSGDTDLAFYVKQSEDDWASNSSVFYVRNNGQLYAQKADITGKITASSGKIGSWNIGDMGNYTDSIYSTFCAASTPSTTDPEYAVFMRGKGSSASTIAIGVKKRTSSSTSWGDAEETFYVLKNGHVKMTDADVTGKIHASSGEISGNLNISGGLINTRGDYTVTLRGVQSDVSKGVFYITDNSSGSAEYPVRINGDGSAKFTNVTITGSSTIASACIPNLNADKITAGTLNVDRIPNISAGKITSGTISTDRLSSSVITTSNFSSKTLTTGNLSVTNGGNIGVWTINSNNYLYAISGSYGVSLSATSVSHGQGGSTTWVNIVKAGQNASDKRLKKNISEFDNTLDGIFDSLKPVQFEYSKDFLGHGVHFGYIAQDVVKSFEDAGKNIDDYSFIYETEIEDNSEDRYYQLNHTDFIALNTWQIQKLKTRIEELENKLAVLET